LIGRYGYVNACAWTRRRTRKDLGQQNALYELLLTPEGPPLHNLADNLELFVHVLTWGGVALHTAWHGFTTPNAFQYSTNHIWARMVVLKDGAIKEALLAGNTLSSCARFEYPVMGRIS